eukprot:g7636.t1
MENQKSGGWDKARRQLGFEHGTSEPQQGWNGIIDALELPSSQAREQIEDSPPSNEAASSSVTKTIQDSEPSENGHTSLDRDRNEMGWGTAQEIGELNDSVKLCLKIEGMDPDRYFVKNIKEFDSVVDYYIDLHERLNPEDLDLFVSFWYKLGHTHPLVLAMKSKFESKNYNGCGYDKTLLQEEEEERPQTHMKREPTIVSQEAEQAGTRVMVPGVNSFGYECRSLSWVVRTGPPSSPLQSQMHNHHNHHHGQMNLPGTRLPVIQADSARANTGSQQSPMSGTGCPELEPNLPSFRHGQNWNTYRPSPAQAPAPPSIPPPAPVPPQVNVQSVNQTSVSETKESTSIRSIFRCCCFTP